MAEALITSVVRQYGSLVWKELEQEVKPVAGVSQDVEDLTNTLTMLQVLLRDAEVKQVTDPAVRAWLEALKDIAYDADDVVDEWCTRLQLSKLNPDAAGMLHSIIHNPDTPGMIKNLFYYVFTPCFHYVPSFISCCVPDVFRRHHQIALHIQDIKERLDGVARDNICDRLNKIPGRQILHRRPDTSSMVNVPEIYGRDGDKKSIVHWLQSESSKNEIFTSVPILSIVGIAGFGKTTLAQLVYQQEKCNFELSIWVCASHPFDREKVSKEIIEQATKKENLNFIGWKSRHQQLSDSVRGKRFLIVLDDVWSKNPEDWAPFKLSLNGGARGSKVIVTTRDKGVATMMDSAVHILAGLSDQDCWLLFRDTAFGRQSEKEHEKFEEIGKQIVKKCKGVPLAVKTAASVVQYKHTKIEWRNMLANGIWKIQRGEDGFLPSLLLGYVDLPSHLKQCFLYCAIFPKDEIIEKDALVKLWMAQGFLGLDGDEELEMIGGEYFDDLAMRSLFQDFKEDYEGNIIFCKMHDLVHDLVQFLTKTEYAILEMNDIGSYCSKLRHLNVGDSEFLENPSCSNMKKLRTLIVRGYEPVPFGKLFCQLTCLRTLVLSFYKLKELPDEVGSLLHLRYLELYGFDLTKLPETMCNLYNLQTLKLKECYRLSKLPEGFGRLLNLRHLECKNVHLKYFPQGFGKLTHLRTLTTFIVSKASGGCKLEELRDLNLIGGELKIQGLEQVENIDEAKQAELQKKENLVSLTLSFDGMDQRNTTTLEGILEGLQPPWYLEELIINCYPGLTFPYWMSKLSDIVKLELFGCDNCIQLPTLGMLPALETLRIGRCYSIKQVGVEFLGISEPESHHEPTFPKLRELHLVELTEWEEWDLPLSLFNSQNEILPCLVRLKISECRKLKSLPIAISKLPSLEDLFLANMSWSNDVFGISEHCGFGNGESIPSSSVPLFPELTTLKLHGMKEWKEEIHQITTASSTISPIIMPNLRSLSIRSCSNLKVIPNYLLSCNQRELTIGDCPQLTVGMEPYNLQLLESLTLAFNVGVFSMSLAPLININTIQNLKSICLASSPHSSLPQGLNHLTSLQKLVIQYCKLMDFDPEEELSSEHFPKLQELSIEQSDLMTQRCSRVNWSNLSQISQISVDYNQIRG